MMEPAKNNNEFQFFIFNIQEDTEYWVESNSVKSGVFKPHGRRLPYVKRIDQTQLPRPTPASRRKRWRTRRTSPSSPARR